MTSVALLTRIVGNDSEARARLAAAGIETAIDLAGYDRLMRQPDGLARWHDIAAGIHGLVVGLQPVDRALFEAAPGLRYVLRVGTGLDNIDVEEAERRGVIIANLAGLNADAVAEHAFALLLAAALRIVESDASMRKDEWTRFPGKQLGGRTLGLIGYGAIGSAMVPKARGFGMDVIVYRRSGSPGDMTDGVPCVSLDELLERADFISVHVPLTAETRGLIGAAEIARMRDDVVLVNTARGEVVDEQALAAALHSGKIRAAGVDVFEEEPPVGSPLLSAPNAILTPHNGGYSDVVMRRVASAAADFMIEHLP